MRIVHVITGLRAGGAEGMLAKLLSGMDRSRFQNIVVSLTDRDMLGPRIEALGVPVYTLGMRRGLPAQMALWRLWRLLRRERPDLLQTWLYHADLLGLVAGRLAGVARIAWNVRCSNMDMHHYSALSALVVWMLARVSGWPDMVLVNSAEGRRVHERLGYRPRRWEFVPNGFELDRFRPNPEARAALRRELGVPADHCLIGLVARFDPMKDHATFLQAAAVLSRDHSETEFVLVGRDVDHANVALRRLISESGVGGRVHLLGERPDIDRILPALDIAGLSSAFGEGFPNVLGEAMACGVPCVVTDVGDSAIIAGDTGRVIPCKDPEALATAWRDLIRLGKEGRRQLGEAARRRIAATYALPAIVERYERLYNELGPEHTRPLVLEEPWPAAARTDGPRHAPGDRPDKG